MNDSISENNITESITVTPFAAENIKQLQEDLRKHQDDFNKYKNRQKAISVLGWLWKAGTMIF